jgi:hypothetical protein
MPVPGEHSIVRNVSGEPIEDAKLDLILPPQGIVLLPWKIADAFMQRHNEPDEASLVVEYGGPKARMESLFKELQRPDEAAA